jgi:hypothetical protein
MVNTVMTASNAESQDTMNSKSTLSVCDAMRDNTDEIIMKIESLLPSSIESFADFQSEYLRIARDFFGTCYIAEKELLDKIGVDQKAIIEFNKYLKVLSQYAISEIDMVDNLQKIFVNNAISAMKVYDDYVKIMLSSYAKTLEHISSMLPKKSE